MSIEIQNITKLYGEQKALNNISISINQGEITGLLGPNGAGKSTLMKIISCFLPPSSGSATVHGTDVMLDPGKVKSIIGYLPEQNPLYTDMYVREYLEYICGIYQLKDHLKDRINKVIEQTGLSVEQNKKIGALSKGYRQRVGLAQALIHDPEVLILDEPTTGLDPNQIIEIRELIKNIGKNKTILLSTHIMQEVEAMCDRVIIINKGELVAADKTSHLSQLLDASESILLELDQEIDRSELLSINFISDVINIASRKYELIATNNAKARAEIFQWAVRSDIQILSMNTKEKNLENIFRQLTK